MAGVKAARWGEPSLCKLPGFPVLAPVLDPWSLLRLEKGSKASGLSEKRSFSQQQNYLVTHRLWVAAAPPSVAGHA